MPDLKLTLSAEDLGADNGVLVNWVKELGDWVRKQEVIAVCRVDDREVTLKAPGSRRVEEDQCGTRCEF